MTNTTDNNRDAASIISSTLAPDHGPAIAVHDGNFHADDVAGVAVVQLATGVTRLIRTRDQEVLDASTYVLDVGGVYDPDANRFDHHQREGKPAPRANEVPYSSFGLVWKKYGEVICGSAKVAADVDKRLVQPIDAADCGFKLFEGGRPTVNGVAHFTVSAVVSSFNPTDPDATPADFNQGFGEAVEFFRGLLCRTIDASRKKLEGEAPIRAALAAAVDKRIIELPSGGPGWDEVLCEAAEPLYVVFKAEASSAQTWMVQCVPPEPRSFDKRRPLPETWAGLRDTELATLTGVPDAVFCHLGRFICGAGSREGALALARLALVA